MNDTKAVLAIVIGVAVIIVVSTMKQFYAARGSLGVTVSNRQIATWKGRLLFWAVGAVMILVGLKFFVFDR